MWDCVKAVADHWQTLIAGLLGLTGGFVAYCGALRAAKRQVAAAREQTEAAREQTQRMREMERRRVAREGFAFYAMLEAAMGATREDVDRARVILTKIPQGVEGARARAADTMRQCIKRAGFTELRPAFLHFGGMTLTEKFLRLDKEIESFVQSHVRAEGELREQLAQIELLTRALQGEAEFGIKQTRSVLPDDIA